jgi:hypothetical protein
MKITEQASEGESARKPAAESGDDTAVNLGRKNPPVVFHAAQADPQKANNPNRDQYAQGTKHTGHQPPKPFRARTLDRHDRLRAATRLGVVAAVDADHRVLLQRGGTLRTPMAEHHVGKLIKEVAFLILRVLSRRGPLLRGRRFRSFAFHRGRRLGLGRWCGSRLGRLGIATTPGGRSCFDHENVAARFAADLFARQLGGAFELLLAVRTGNENSLWHDPRCSSPAALLGTLPQPRQIP